MNPQLLRGFLEMAVLKIISKREIYGYDIVRVLKEQNLSLNESNIYAILRKSLKEGYLLVRKDTSSNGPPRNYYSLSPAGKEHLQILETDWCHIVRTYSRIDDFIGW